MTSRRAVTSRRTRILLAWLPAVAYMVGIWILSSVVIEVPTHRVPLQDKGLHFAEYTILGLLLQHAVLRTWPERGPWRALAFALLIGAGWALLDELHQALVPGRHGDVLDMVADTVGVLLGAGVRLAWYARGSRTGQAPARRNDEPAEEER